MATGVLFGNPQTLISQPGAYTRAIAEGLNFSPPFSFNTICCVGAGLGGTPLVPYYFTDPDDARRLFGAGTPLAESIRLAFMGGANGGAAVVVGIRADNAGQASGVLSAANGGAGLSATFADYGAYGNTFSLNFFPGSAVGVMATLEGKTVLGENYYQKFDNIPTLGELLAKINNESPVTVTVTEGGVKASQTFVIATSATDGRAQIDGLQGEAAYTTSAYGYQVPSSTIASSEDSLRFSWDTSTSPLSVSVTAISTANNTLTLAASHGVTEGMYLRFAGATLPTNISANTTYIARSLSSNDVQISPKIDNGNRFLVASVSGSTITSTGHTLQNGYCVVFGGDVLPTSITRDRVYFVRGVAPNTFEIATTAGGSAIALSGTATNVDVTVVSLAAVVDIEGTVSGVTATKSPAHLVVSSSNPTSFHGTYAVTNLYNTWTLAVTSMVVSVTTYASDVARFKLAAGETWEHDLGKGQIGGIFAIATGTYAGTYQILHHEWDGLGEDRTRVVRKLTGDRRVTPGTYTGDLSGWVVATLPRVQPANNAVESLVPAQGLLATGGQYLTATVGDNVAFYNTQIGDTVELVGQELARALNNHPEISKVAVATVAYNVATYTSTITVTALQPGTLSNTIRTSIQVNPQPTLTVSAGGATLTGGDEALPPQDAEGNITGAITFAGGYDSVPTYQRWLDALQTAQDLRVRWLVPAGTDDFGVQAAFADHVALMSGTAQRRERAMVCGHGLGWTTTEIRDRAESFQSGRVIFVSPGVETRDDVTGLLRMYPSYYTAAIVAGMLAAEGNGVSDPITHSFLRNITRLETAYKPGSLETDNLLSSGVLVIEADPALTRASRGFRVVRGITTQRATGNTQGRTNQFESIAVVSQSDYCASRIRDMQESLFIGKGIFPSTLESIRVRVNMELDAISREGYLYGYNPRATQVTLSNQSPDAIDVQYRIYPSPGLDFILNTQILLPIPAN